MAEDYSVRRVQEVLKQIRAESADARADNYSDDCHSDETVVVRRISIQSNP
jgi:hypothetical protein